MKRGKMMISFIKQQFQRLTFEQGPESTVLPINSNKQERNKAACSFRLPAEDLLFRVGERKAQRAHAAMSVLRRTLTALAAICSCLIGCVRASDNKLQPQRLNVRRLASGGLNRYLGVFGQQPATSVPTESAFKSLFNRNWYYSDKPRDKKKNRAHLKNRLKAPTDKKMFMKGMMQMKKKEKGKNKESSSTFPPISPPTIVPARFPTISPTASTAVPSLQVPSSTSSQPMVTAPISGPSTATTGSPAATTAPKKFPTISPTVSSAVPSLRVPSSTSSQPIATAPSSGPSTAITGPSAGTPQTLPNLPVVPTVPCPQDPICNHIMAALDPVFPPKTRALINVPGTCQNWTREWLRSGEGVMEFQFDRIRQRYTMALFYCELDGDNWLDGELWLTEAHECDWYSIVGVDPCSRTEEYQIIRGSGQLMRGTLPPELSMISSLWEITLFDNMIFGTIPEDFTRLSQLDTIALSVNLFTGTIPDFMWEFKDMTYLDLAKNFFTGTIPDTVHLTEPKLQDLFIENNNLSGSIPSTFGSLNWRRLHMDGNGFTGSVPADINSANLEELMLHNNMLTGTFPADSFANDFGGQSKLREVTLYNNDITGDLDEMCNLFIDGKLEVLAVDLDTVKCQCCSGAP
jgi:hypothetical protein